MKSGSHLVIEASNLRGREVTTLAWDIAGRLSTFLDFEGEIVIGWKGTQLYRFGGKYGYGYDHSYCLVFTRGPT